MSEAKEIDASAYAELEAIVGARHCSRSPHVRDSYAAQPFHKVEPGVWIHRPLAVVLPQTVDEVQAIVRLCVKYRLRYKALSTGWGAQAGPGFDNVVQIDLRRMSRILELDVPNRVIVLEPYVTCAQVQAEVMRHGLNLHIHGAGSNCSPLASATSHMGMGFTGISMGTAPRNLMGVEWVLPTGDLLRIGSFGSGAGWVSPDGPGPSLRGIMRGWAGADGGFGIFTKCALKLYDWSGPPTLERSGRMWDLRLRVPENNRLYACLFADLERYGEALHQVGWAGIGYLQAKIATGLAAAILDPPRFRAAVKNSIRRKERRSPPVSTCPSSRWWWRSAGPREERCSSRGSQAMAPRPSPARFRPSWR